MLRLAWLGRGRRRETSDDGATRRVMCRRCGISPWRTGGGNAVRLVRRPRAGFVAPHPGRLGSRSGGITTAPRGARWTGTGANASSQETRTRGREIAAMERRQAPAHRQRCAARLTTGAPSGAPSPRHSRGKEGTTAYPAPQRIGAMTRVCVRPPATSPLRRSRTPAPCGPISPDRRRPRRCSAGSPSASHPDRARCARRRKAE